jgi:hypothetical protein
MLVVAAKYNVSRYAIMMVACMTVPEIYSDLPSRVEEFKQQQQVPQKDEDDEVDHDLLTTIDFDRK